MILLGLALYLLNRTFSSVLDWFLPLIYITVIVLGLLMLTGRNPFSRLSATRSPLVQNQYLSAFLYGMLLGPMTLPCTGPIIISGFVLGSGSAASLADGIFYFIAFGLGFGWPLVVLAIVATPLQRRMTGWLNRNYLLLSRVSGTLLVSIGLYGFWTEAVPILSA